MQDFDLIVLGAGNSMDLIRDAGEAGLRVAVVEKGPLGGTCPNRGCIPSKLVIAHADAAQAVRAAGRFHVQARIDGIDASRALRETKEYVGRFDSLIEDDLPAGVTLFRGHGRFSGERTVEVDGRELRAPQVVVATGSRPRRLDLGVPYWTSDEVFRQEEAPGSITIVGGGYVGCELAHFFHGVGVETRLVVRGEHLLSHEDEEICHVFQKAFTARVPVTFGTELEKAEHDGARYRLTLTNGDVLESVALLLAIGRAPNSDDLGLEHAGVKTDSRGYVVVDGRLRTSAEGVHAMGDVTGRYPFTHAASFEATYLAARLLGRTDAPIDYGPMPHAVFTEPELAGVGPTEEELKARGVDYVKAAVPYDSVTKGRALKEEHGLAKLLLDREGKILGAHLVGAHASILLHEILPVMKWRNHVRSLTGLIHVHPSLPEVVRGVARKAEAML